MVEGVIVASIFQRTDEVNRGLERAGLSRIAPSVLKLLRPSIRLIVGAEAVIRIRFSPSLIW